MLDSFIATAPIKLVIWDLDDTFWSGTLSEGGISLIDRNISIVRTLVDRGIMCSISSKNDLGPARQILKDAGIWDLFVFPQICWSSKGGSVAAILEDAGLRPENTLFIDDNAINIEEVRFRFPSIMTAFPEAVLADLLNLEEAKGKDDTAHSRLQQYKQLEQKADDRRNTTLSNEDFLRHSGIRLRFDANVENYLERIIELINRSNQLNFTKVRLESARAVDEFKRNLKRHDVFSAVIFAQDRYGDHGLIGFYMQLKNERTNKLIHYVWSCRMMNVGLEQYVYEKLSNPEIEVIGPVANGIKVFDRIDWISEDQAISARLPSDDARLLLIGSCDLTAVASYCSANRVEYVNGVKDGVMTRYDDFGFILGDQSRIAASTALTRIPCWEASDFTKFHQDVTECETLIVSLSAAVKGAYLVSADGVAVRLHPDGLGAYVDTVPLAGFLKGAKFYDIDTDQKFALLERSLRLLDQSATKAKDRFLLGANTRSNGAALSKANYDLLTRYNSECEEFCRSTDGWQFVPINDVVSVDKLVDDRHYSRLGYFDIASYITERIGQQTAVRDGEVSRDSAILAEPDVIDVIRSGRRVSRFSLFGSRRGVLGQFRRLVKITPLASILRKLFRSDPLLRSPAQSNQDSDRNGWRTAARLVRR